MKHLVLILALLAASNAAAYGHYNVDVIRVVDGDTVDVKVYTFINQFQFERLRLAVVDTPELRSSSPCERVLARDASAFTSNFLSGGDVTITTSKRGSFGRPIAELKADGQDLGDALLKAGLGKLYVKKSLRKPWCEDL